jgi:NitT/TauT family transport system substrate-binding protein
MRSLLALSGPGCKPERPRVGARIFAAVGVVALSLSLVAGARAETVKIRIAEVVRSQFYVPFYIALGKGFAKEEGLDVELITVNGGNKLGSLVLTGGADIGLAGPEVPIYIFNSESPDKPVIISAVTGTDGFFFASRKKIDNFQWSMVDGKVLAYPKGTTPTMFIEHLMKKNGVKPAVLKEGMLTNIAVPARDGAWVSGQGDFGVFMEPNLSKLEKAGQLHVLKSIGKEVGRADYTVFFVTRSWLQKNPTTAQAWVNSMAHAQAWMRGASPAEIAKVINPYFPSTTVEETEALVNRYRNTGAPIWSDTPLVDRAGLETMQKIMVEGGTLPADKVVPYDAIVDARLADNATRKFPAK